MSPTVFRKGGYRFFFFSREERRMHVHVAAGSCEAKFWILPKVELAQNRRFSARQLREIETILEENLDELEEAWRQHFTG
ncbi:MAG: hypothetical protein CVU59_09830 [Deltaproteobacteria bacterium HGW-Deltaproteobacteria-17]|nr:MAG: hypothetical protein CVU59_09830 [Deltaproteobacteria bacterium HGW-Deltaproteobacteria-17]